MDPNEIAELVSDLEDRVERLRALYDQYFMGIERLEPLILRKEVDRKIWQLRREQIRNTALRFKLQTTIQRYNTYQQFWQRTCREIENGTYYRDVTRAAERFGEAALTAMGRKRQKMFQKGATKRSERAARTNSVPASAADPAIAPPARAPGGMSAGLDGAPSETGAGPHTPPETPHEPLGLESFDDLASLAGEVIDALAPHPGAVLAQTPGRGDPPRQPRPAGGGTAEPAASAQHPAAAARAGAHARDEAARRADSGDLSPARLREIYGAYVDAKRRCFESTANITFDRLAANLQQTAKQLRAKHPGRRVDFEVVVKNGTAVLKPIVRA